jgi:hypothetical protein
MVGGECTIMVMLGKDMEERDSVGPKKVGVEAVVLVGAKGRQPR